MITAAWLAWNFQVLMHAISPNFYPAVEYQEPPKYVQHAPSTTPGYRKAER